MKSRLPLILGAFGILALAAILFLFLRPGDQSGLQDPRLTQHRIVYECKRDSSFTEDNYNICSIDANGSHRTQLAGGTSNETTFGSPIFNGNGDVVFHCQYFEVGRAGVQHNICAVRNGNQESEQLSFPRGVERTDLIGINENGQIVASCGEKLCISQLDAEDYEFIPNSDFNGQAIGPSINNRDQIAFSCWLLSSSSSREICAIRPDGSDFRILSNSGNGRSFNPQLLDSGLIIYTCGDDLDVFNICSMNYDGSESQQLTQAVNREDNLNPAVNVALNVIVYECWQDVLHAHLCAMKLDGSEQRQLTPNSDHVNAFKYINPSISADGLVVFGCNDQLCIIELDGTGMTTLTGDATREFVARRPVIYYSGE